MRKKDLNQTYPRRAPEAAPRFGSKEERRNSATGEGFVLEMEEQKNVSFMHGKVDTTNTPEKHTREHAPKKIKNKTPPVRFVFPPRLPPAYSPVTFWRRHEKVAARPRPVPRPPPSFTHSPGKLCSPESSSSLSLSRFS